MATSLKAFEAIQIGRETTKGTRVAATRKLVGNGMLKEEIDRYYSEYPRGYLATVGGDGVVVRKGTMFEIESELCPQELLWPLLLGVKGAVSPTGAGADRTWTFSPTLNAEPTLDAATVEFQVSDGSTNHVQIEAGYVMCQSFSVEWAFNQIAKLRWTGFGRARQSDTPTAALTPYTNRKQLVSALTSVYIDSTYAGIGGTQVSSVVRSGKLDVTCFPKPIYAIAGRSDLDFLEHGLQPLAAKLSLVFELNAGGATLYSAWRAGTRQYIRVKTIGDTLGGSNYSTSFDGSYRILGASISYDGPQALVTLDCEAVFDDTASKIFEAVVVNDLTALASL